MSSNISPIGNHDLDTSTIENLAFDLSNRLDCNIIYGYSGYSEYFEMLGNPQPDDYIELGRIILDSKEKIYYLSEENYQEKQLYHKFGSEIFEDEKFWWMYNFDDIPNRIIDMTMKEIELPTYELISRNDDHSFWIDIHQEIYMNQTPYFSKWYSFTELFLKKEFNYKSTLEQLNLFRIELMKLNILFGGNKMYYLNDQSVIYPGIGQGDENQYTWEEFENKMKETCQDNIMDIVLMLNDKEYQKAYLKAKKKIYCLIDDFTDLKL